MNDYYALTHMVASQFNRTTDPPQTWILIGEGKVILETSNSKGVSKFE